MTDSSMQNKWDDIYRQADSPPVKPTDVVSQNAHLLPSEGLALEVACGLGANSLFLAERGLQVHAWDISQVAVERLREEATQRRLRIIADVRDIIEDPPMSRSFDVIVVSHFLDRALFPKLVSALKSGGLLFYQTFSRARVDDSGPRNPEFRLDDNELIKLCEGMRVLAYREDGVVGDLTKGLRNLACIVAQKKD